MTGSLFIVAAPSGAGKTSLVNALVARHDDIRLSVSHTTRPPRAGEVDGRDYHFVSQEIFSEMREKGDFLECATVFDNSYGTSSAGVEKTLAQGLDVILEIDWQGAQQIRKNLSDVTAIFILPPTREILERRLRNRGQDDEEIISRRMRDVEEQISHYVEFDYLIVNDDFDDALSSLTAIIMAKRLSMALQKQKQARLITELLG